MMEAAWILPLLNGLLLCAGVAISTFLFISLRNEIRRLRSSAVSKEELALQPNKDLTVQLQELKIYVERLHTRVADLQPSAPPTGERVLETTSVNLNREGQVLRLHRRGTSISDIATALKLPAGEVRLIVKVYELSRSFPTVTASSENL